MKRYHLKNEEYWATVFLAQDGGLDIWSSLGRFSCILDVCTSNVPRTLAKMLTQKPEEYWLQLLSAEQCSAELTARQVLSALDNLRRDGVLDADVHEEEIGLTYALCEGGITTSEWLYSTSLEEPHTLIAYDYLTETRTFVKQVLPLLLEALENELMLPSHGN